MQPELWRSSQGLVWLPQHWQTLRIFFRVTALVRQTGQVVRQGCGACALHGKFTRHQTVLFRRSLRRATLLHVQSRKQAVPSFLSRWMNLGCVAHRAPLPQTAAVEGSSTATLLTTALAGRAVCPVEPVFLQAEKATHAPVRIYNESLLRTPLATLAHLQTVTLGQCTKNYVQKQVLPFGSH